MIHPIQFLWKQLNGPQITAITQAVFRYLRDSFDNLLEYFRFFGIDTATPEHAEIIGLLNRFSRPILQEYRRAFFFFTYRRERHNLERGFSTLVDTSHGGKFSALAENVRITEKMDIRTYKALLHTFLDCEGQMDSLKMLDDICARLIELDAKEPSTQQYTFEWNLRNNGSLTVHLGSMEDWYNPQRVQAVIASLANTIFFPEPALDASLTTTPGPGPGPEPPTPTTTLTANSSLFPELSEGTAGSLTNMYTSDLAELAFTTECYFPNDPRITSVFGDFIKVGLLEAGNNGLVLKETNSTNSSVVSIPSSCIYISAIKPAWDSVKFPPADYASTYARYQAMTDVGTFYLNDEIGTFVPIDDESITVTPILMGVYGPDTVQGYTEGNISYVRLHAQGFNYDERCAFVRYPFGIKLNEGDSLDWGERYSADVSFTNAFAVPEGGGYIVPCIPTGWVYEGYVDMHAPKYNVGSPAFLFVQINS